jgi:hypothetical protein
MNHLIRNIAATLIIGVCGASLASAQTVSVPAAQRQLTAILSKYNDRYETAPNDIQKDKIAAAFRSTFCEALPRSVTGWIGAVWQIDDNTPDKSINLELGIHTNELHGGGLGIVLVLGNVANDVHGNVRANVRIPVGSKLYQIASNLGDHDVVEFSGQFIPFTSEQACEKNLSGSTYISLFRFTSIRKIGSDIDF